MSLIIDLHVRSVCSSRAKDTNFSFINVYFESKTCTKVLNNPKGLLKVFDITRHQAKVFLSHEAPKVPPPPRHTTGQEAHRGGSRVAGSLRFSGGDGRPHAGLGQQADNNNPPHYPTPWLVTPASCPIFILDRASLISHTGTGGTTGDLLGEG